MRAEMRFDDWIDAVDDATPRDGLVGAVNGSSEGDARGRWGRDVYGLVMRAVCAVVVTFVNGIYGNNKDVIITIIVKATGLTSPFSSSSSNHHHRH